MFTLSQNMMQKRLRYSMPRKPLSDYDLDNSTEDGNGDHQEAAPIVAAGTNVGVMAKRIRQMERKKRQVYQPPAERPLGGDLPSSESDESETDSADASLINE